MTTAMEFVSAARSLMGIGWRHRGRSRHGVDCVGLVAEAHRLSGTPFSDASHYGREPWDDRLRKECAARWGTALPPHSAMPGDILLVRWHGKEPSHVAIAGSDGGGGLTVIHAHNLHGVIEQSLRDHLTSVVIEAYRPAWEKPDVP